MNEALAASTAECLGFSAELLADSVNPAGERISTVVIRYPRFILAEVNTHRSHSRNTASSRAIPTPKLLKQALFSPYVPGYGMVGQNQKGMQAEKSLSGWRLHAGRLIWRMGSICAVAQSAMLHRLGWHKQHANRPLEPYLWTTQILTSMESGWKNLLSQRLHKDAQPEFFAVAYLINKLLGASYPKVLDWGEWHVPFYGEGGIIAACGRCARVSYLSHDGSKSIAEDLRLARRLAINQPPHYSPFEHVAEATCQHDLSNETPRFGNLKGWKSVRYRLEQCSNKEVTIDRLINKHNHRREG